MKIKAPPKPAPLHFRRMEFKYIVPERFIPWFIDRISPYTEPDPFLVEEGKGRTIYPVTSLYFDSVDLQSLREKDAGILARRKLRLRTYERTFGEATTAFLEIKRRSDFIVSKDRLSLSVGRVSGVDRMSRLLDHLLSRVEATEDVTAEAQTLRSWYNLQPTAIVAYDRIPFVGKHDRKFRVTVDYGLRGAWHPSKLIGDVPLHRCMTGYCIVELKMNHGIPSWFHDVIQDFQMSRTAYSKYAMVVSALHPLAVGQIPEVSRFHTFY
ncbi:MAG: polyphosphate polymerase domain-containing protein [Candidatus Peregrinibacteria bacterium]|nr:polyphosphate polymerase domain-containing protein [Candidatus Peregrinibacteria bacterium]